MQEMSGHKGGKPGVGGKEFQKALEALPLSLSGSSSKPSAVLATFTPDTKTMSLAQANKDEGNVQFKAQEIDGAIKAYKIVVKLLSPEGMVPQERHAGRELLLSGYLNLAQCALKNEEWYSTIEHSTRALTFQPGNGKTLYRRGRARLHIETRLEEAKADFLAAAKLDPQNAAIRERLEECKKKLKDARTKQLPIERSSLEPAKKFEFAFNEAKNRNSQTGRAGEPSSSLAATSARSASSPKAKAVASPKAKAPASPKAKAAAGTLHLIHTIDDFVDCP